MSENLATIGIIADTRSLKKGEAEMGRFAATGEITERRIVRSGGAMSGALYAVSASAVRMAAVAGASLGAFAGGALFVGAIREQEQLQTNMLKTQSIIEATGGAAGKSSAQLLGEARALARATLLSTEAVMSAQQTMLTFRHITGETFDRAISAAADMSQALGTDLNSAVLQVSKALEDPVTGMTALTRSGTVFTQSQKDLVKSMVEVGDVAGAQAFILGELESQYGGVAAAAAGGLAGAIDSLGQSWQEMKIALADSLSMGAGATNILSGLTVVIDFLAQNMDVVTNTALIAASAFGVKLAAGFVKSRGAAVLFSGGLAMVRSALISTGIGALIVTAGVLVTWMGKLADATGGWGNAVVTVGMVVKEAFSNWQLIMGLMWEAWTSGANSWYISFLEVLRDAGKNVVDFINKSAKGFAIIAHMVMNPSESQSEFEAFYNGLNDAAPMIGDFSTAIGNARARMEEANGTMVALQGALSASSPKYKELVALMDDLSASGDVSAAAVDQLRLALERVPAAVGGARAAGTAVETLANKLKSLGKDALAKVGTAFSDFFNRGFKDFGSFARSILSTFGKMLLQMIWMAKKNKIMVSLGIGGGGSGGGGLIGKVLGKSIGGGIGAFATAGTAAAAGTAGTGLLGGFGASLGVGGAGSGLFAVGANAAAAGGGLMASIGAALPVVGIGLAIFGLFKMFKRKPPISQKDFRIIQTGLKLTGMEMLGAGHAGQVAAAHIKNFAGGVKNFTKLTESYYSNFYTEEEKRQRAIDGIGDVFSKLGLAVPPTSKAFRELVESQDLTTREGQKTYASLLKVSGAFATVYGGVNNTVTALDKLSAQFGGNIFSTLVDQRRAAAYKASGVEYLTARPDSVGNGAAFRGTGPRVITRADYDMQAAQAKQAGELAAQSALLQNILLDGKKSLRLQQQWQGDAMPVRLVT